MIGLHQNGKVKPRRRQCIGSVLKAVENYIENEADPVDALVASAASGHLGGETKYQGVSEQQSQNGIPRHGPDFGALRRGWENVMRSKGRAFSHFGINASESKEIKAEEQANEKKTTNSEPLFLNPSELISAQTKLVQALGNPCLLGNTRSLFIFPERKDSNEISPFNPNAIDLSRNGTRAFLFQSFQAIESDVHEFLILFDKHASIKEAFQSILTSRFYFDTSYQEKLLDFQTCLLPLLFILSHPRIELSPINEMANFLYSIAKTALPNLLSDFVTCMRKALDLKAFHPQTLNAYATESPFFPFSFAQGFYPMIKFLDILFRRFQECALDYAILKHMTKLEELLVMWESAFESGALTRTKESKNALGIVLKEYQALKALPLNIIDVTERLEFLRERERAEKLALSSDPWKDPPLQPPSHLFDNDHANYKNIQLIPTMQEILFSGNLCVPGNLPFSPSAHWLKPGPERLLDTHFRLLRMDMVAKIRLNLQVFIEHLQVGSTISCGRFSEHLGNQSADMMVYTNAKVKLPTFDKFYGVCHDLEFDAPDSIQYSFSKFKESHLQKDGLLCLVYYDKFSKHSVQVHFVTIGKGGVTKDALDRRLKVPISGVNMDAGRLQGISMYLIEFQAFLYEAYRPVLRSLQLMNHAELPFSAILCPPSPPALQSLSVEVPAYLKRIPISYSFYFLRQKANAQRVLEDSLQKHETGLEMHRTFCLGKDDITEFASYLEQKTSLDKSQAKCLLGALTSNVCCIQGPPGTGKTFIGVQIVKALLQYPETILRILVISLTNHALDQFLCHLKNEKIQNIVRISTVTNPELQALDLNMQPRPRFSCVNLREVHLRMEELQVAFMSSITELNAPMHFKGVWNYLETYFSEVAENIMWPFLSSECISSCLQHWLENKDPPTRRIKMLTRKDKFGRRKSRKRFRFLDERSEELEEDVTLEQRFEKLNLKTLPKVTELETDKTESCYSNHTASSIIKEMERLDLTDRLDLMDFDDLHEEPWEDTVFDYDMDERTLRINPLTAKDLFFHALHNTESVPENKETQKKMSMWDLELAERKRLYEGWKKDASSILENYFSNLKLEYEQEVAKYRSRLTMKTSEQMSNARIVGITTTRVSKNLDALKHWGPTVILCEEAGEILEAHILASLSSTVEQLILIGDHKQLRPRISEYDLSIESRIGQQYRLDVSLFERLLDPTCHLPLYTLQEQRRMKPIISQFIRQTIYPHLLDGADVKDRPRIRGMLKDVFFMTHNRPQISREAELGSLGHSNQFEVEMVVATVKYLLAQEYLPDQIVVLTPYQAQLELLNSQILLLRQNLKYLCPNYEPKSKSAYGENTNSSNTLRVSSIDSFQGEESDIVVISLVRSTFEHGTEYGIGFLKLENRVNVLLSRARHGMYLFGNAQLLSKCSKMWKSVLTTMEEQELLGDKLPISCLKHPERRIYVQSAADFEASSCSEKCMFRLSCGHVCTRTCHSVDPEHKTYECSLPCEVRHSACGHQCIKACHEPCGECEAIIDDMILPGCGHVLKSPKCHIQFQLETVVCKEKVEHRRPCEHGSIFVPCNQDAELFMMEHPCTEVMATITFPNCIHTLHSPKCHELKDLNNKICQEKVFKERSCGHSISVGCAEDVNLKVCTFKCGKPLPCGHACTEPCGTCNKENAEQHGVCSVKWTKQRPCLHKCTAKCGDHSSAGSCSMNCYEPCLKTACVHQDCNEPCFEICEPCLRPCTWTCEHQATCPYPCGYPCIRFPCDLRCDKQLECGHRCPSVCGEPCPPSKYCVECNSALKVLEDDELALICMYATSLNDLPLLFLNCGHFFPMRVLDDVFQLNKYYEMKDTQWISIKYPEQTEVKSLSCPNCKYPVCARDVHRYSRIIKLSILKNADEAHFIKFLSNLVQAAASTSNFEACRNLFSVQPYNFQSIENSIDTCFNRLGKSNSHQVAHQIMDSSVLDAFPHLPTYQLLLNSPQYATLHGQYYVLKARLKHNQTNKIVHSYQRSLHHFRVFRSNMEAVQDLYHKADEHFEQSNAASRRIQLCVERIYACLDYFTCFLEFVALGDFRTLNARLRVHALQSDLRYIHALLNYLAQMREDIQEWRMTDLFPFFRAYAYQLYKLAKLFERQFKVASQREYAHSSDFLNAVKALASENAALPKYRMLFSSHGVELHKGQYTWQQCTEGHLYPLSLQQSRKSEQGTCLECGAVMVNA